MSIKNLFEGKNVLIFGLGLQGGGSGSARFALSRGAIVRATDLRSSKELESTLKELPKKISLTLGEHTPEDIKWADVIIKNPAVADTNKFISLANNLGKKVVMAEALYLKYSQLKTIGITGTRGKSTTTHLLFDILSKKYPEQVLFGGNIPGTSALELLDQEVNKKYAVLELSSFQLRGCHHLQVSPNIACITNIYEDHLNRYSTMEEYMEDKLAILKYQAPDDSAFLNSAQPLVKEFEKHVKGDLHWFSSVDLTSKLPGKHNKENIAAASAISSYLDVDEGLIKETVAEFDGLPFRMQMIPSPNDITFINDTTSTTPIATIKAIDSLSADVTLILGGEEKNLSVNALIDKIKNEEKVKNVIILGSKNNDSLNNLLPEIEDKVVGKASSMQEAFSLSLEHTKPGGIVLLSPGFASFDLFNNEFDRGNQFTALVNSLSK